MLLYDAHNHLQDERLAPHLAEVMPAIERGGVDRAVSEVDASTTARVGEATPVRVRVTSTEPRGTAFGVSLRDGGRELGRRTGFSPGPGAEASAEFRVTPTRPGLAVWTARVDSLAGEATHANDARQVALEVSPGRLGVVVVSAALNWDVAFVRRALLGDSAVRLIEPEAQKAGVRLAIAVEPGLPKLCGDAKRINQILINLMSNGIRFSPQGGEVRVSAFRRDDGLYLSVADKGIGIAANDIPKALERFGQLDTDLNRQHEGAGLGLPIAQHLMELHGGTLRISSEPGAGTTVTVTFPTRRIVRERPSIPVRAA